MRHLPFLATLLLVLAAPLAARTPPLFHLNTDADLAGYYMPAKEVRVGAFKLITIALGPREDFVKFAHGETYGGKWAPVLLEFAPAASRAKQGEGGPYWEGSFRVLPASYTVTDTMIRFDGFDKELGEVTFEGKLDAGQVKSEKGFGAGGSGKVVLRGELTAGGKTYSGLSFTWFGGD